MPWRKVFASAPVLGESILSSAWAAASRPRPSCDCSQASTGTQEGKELHKTRVCERGSSSSSLTSKRSEVRRVHYIARPTRGMGFVDDARASRGGQVYHKPWRLQTAEVGAEELLSLGIIY